MARKTKEKRPPPSKPAVPLREISKVTLFLVDGNLCWIASTEPAPCGRMTARIAECITQDSGLGAETKIEWVIPLTDHPQWITRTGWIERRSKLHAIGRHGVDNEGNEWFHSFAGRWRRGQYEDDSACGTEGDIAWVRLHPWRRRQYSQWEVCDENLEPISWAPRDFPPLDTGVLFRELWWARDSSGVHRSRARPAGEFFARIRHFRISENSIRRQEFMLLPAGAPRPALVDELLQTARFLTEKPRLELMVHHPESSETHVRLIRNPAWTRRMEAVAGLAGLAKAMKDGADTEHLVRLAIQAGIDLARAGQEELVPVIEQGGQFLKQQAKGRPSTASAMRGAVLEMVRSLPERDAQSIALVIQDKGKNPDSVIRFIEGRGKSGAGIFRLGPTSWSYATMLKEIRLSINATR